MPNFRRIYLYSVSFLSLETVIWGAIILLWSLSTRNQAGADTPPIAAALSLILAGVPVFILHWRLIQRREVTAPEERSSHLRAFFLHSVLFAVLLPCGLSLFSIFNRIILYGLGAGELPNLLDWGAPLATLLVNGLAAVYFMTLLRKDERELVQETPVGEGLPGDERPFREARRLFGYAWLVFGLSIVILGVQRLLQFLVETGRMVGSGTGFLLGNSLALLLVGIPIWVFFDRYTQQTLKESEEQESLIRTAALYSIVFVSLGSLMVYSGLALYAVWRLVLGESWSLSTFLLQFGRPLSAAIPLGTAWAFYRRAIPTNGFPLIRPKQMWLRGQPHEDTKRSGLLRLYGYILAFLGLTAGFGGVHQLVSFLLAATVGSKNLWGDILENLLASSLAALTIGFPVWFLAWSYLLDQSGRDNEAGDHARRSPVRKVYLYLFTIIGIIGASSSAIQLLFILLSTILGEAPQNPLLAGLQEFSSLTLFGLLLAYHVRIIRVDIRRTERGLARKLAQFPVLVLAPGVAETGRSSDEDDTTPFSQFAFEIVKALKQQAPEMPVAVHPYQKGTPDETLSAAQAVILPAELVAKPTEAVRLWLQGFPGARIVVPGSMSGWYWISGNSHSLPALARKAAQTVRRLATGEVKL